MTNTSSDHTTLEEYCGILKQLIDTTSAIASIENQKASCASQKKPELLDSLLKDEQAYLLKLRGLEQHRMQFQEKLGWKKNLKFRQILEEADESQKQVLLPIFRELDETVRSLSSARESSDRIIHIRLRELENSLANGGRPYDGSGAITQTPISHFHDTYG